MSPVYLAHSRVVYRLPYTLQENEVSKPETCDFSLRYTLQENELSKPEICDFSTLC
jgi:hypothetical protein